MTDSYYLKSNFNPSIYVYCAVIANLSPGHERIGKILSFKEEKSHLSVEYLTLLL